MKFILASQSPRRKELLEQIGMKFDIIISDADEDIPENDPAQLVEKLSLRKAEAVSEAVTGEDICIIGADTVVVFRGEIMGKPKDREDAGRMLSLLSDETHEVYTGVTLIIRNASEEKNFTFHECTQVKLYGISREQMETYLDSGEWSDKAGGYAIQGLAGAYIKEIKGEYANVVGLPVARICHELTKLSIEWLGNER